MSSRPGGVTLVAVLAWLSGAVSIVNGTVYVLGNGLGSLAGWIAIAIGVLTIAVSLGLFRGNPVARVIMTVVFVLSIAVAVWSGFLDEAPAVWASLIQGVVAAIGLALLYARRANEYFK